MILAIIRIFDLIFLKPPSSLWLADIGRDIAFQAFSLYTIDVLKALWSTQKSVALDSVLLVLEKWLLK